METSLSKLKLYKTSNRKAPILLSIPHSGVLCPPEIPINSLSDNQSKLSKHIDWYTDKIYNINELIGCQKIVFPYNQIFVNVNRHPDHLDDSVPLERDSVAIYKKGHEPSEKLRRLMLKKYHHAYHKFISDSDKRIIIDCHSYAPKETKNAVDIAIGNKQYSEFDPKDGFQSAPDAVLDTYTEALIKQLKNLNIKQNVVYKNEYSHVMALHGTASIKRGVRVPVLCQEVNENLYLKNGQLDTEAVEELRRAFAKALIITLNKLFEW